MARYYYGIDVGTVLYWTLMHTPIGQMLHNREIERFKLTVHSKSTTLDAGSFIVRTIALLEDNLAYLLIDKDTGRVAVVDAGDGNRVLEHLREVQSQWDYVHANAAALPQPGASPAASSSHPHSLLAQVRARPELTTILTTHFHYDHSGGNLELIRKVGGSTELRVVGGSAKESVPGANIQATPGTKLWLGGTEIEILSTPCHTKGHVCYYVHGPPAKHRTNAAGGAHEGGAAGGAAGLSRDFSGSGALFTGDTLFVGGVGKFFEGSAEDMYSILYGTFRSLPPETPIFVGHEYTVENLKFAFWLEPGNRHVEEKLAWALRRRADGHSTVPSLLMEERQYNPFMRVHVTAVKQAVAQAVRDARGADMPEVPVMAAMRQLKNAKAHHGSGALRDEKKDKDSLESVLARAEGARAASFAQRAASFSGGASAPARSSFSGASTSAGQPGDASSGKGIGRTASQSGPSGSTDRRASASASGASASASGGEHDEEETESAGLLAASSAHSMVDAAR